MTQSFVAIYGFSKNSCIRFKMNNSVIKTIQVKPNSRIPEEFIGGLSYNWFIEGYGDRQWNFNGYDADRVLEDITLVATDISDKYAYKPILSQDRKTIKYGMYPQTHVNDPSLIEELNNLPDTNKIIGEWYIYYGEFYERP